MKVARVLLGILFLSSGILLAQDKPIKLEELYTGLDNPTSIYVTQQHLFIVESGKHRILQLDHSGNLIQTLGGLGSGEYQFDTPLDIDATNGLKIYVSDYRNNRIQIFDRRFQHLGSITSEGKIGGARPYRPTQIAVNSFGELFIYDEASKAIRKFDENGVLIDTFSNLSGVEHVSDLKINGRNIELIDFNSETVTLLSENGLVGEQFPYVFSFNIDDEVVGFHEINSSVFILTKGSVLKIEAE